MLLPRADLPAELRSGIGRASLVTPALAALVACVRPTSPSATSASDELAGACARCHPAETAEWRASLHRRAFTDADFQASFRSEPLDFCFRCHAPAAAARTDVRGVARGVDCTSCHAVSTEHGEGRGAATTRDCAPCHEFAFPSRPSAMQSTISEHARSPFAAVTCSACHLPRSSDGHRDHRFDVSRNVALLRASIDVDARLSASGAEVALATRNVGHAMPTGDLFRRLVVLVQGESSDGIPLGEEEIVVGRRFDRRHGVAGALDDTRIEGQRTMKLDREWLARAARVFVSVRYDRVAQAEDVVDVRGVHDARATVFASVLLSERTLQRR